MRARGEYRPHRNFGIDYNVRWESGEKPDPEGGLFRETAMNEYSDLRMLSDGFDSMRVGEDREKRPWEVVGGLVMTIKVCCWEILLTFITNGSTRSREII